MKNSKPRPKPYKAKLNPRDKKLVELVLDQFYTDYATGIIVARERYRAAPDLPGMAETVAFYQRGLQVVAQMRTRINQRLPTLEELPDYAPPPAVTT